MVHFACTFRRQRKELFREQVKQSNLAGRSAYGGRLAVVAGTSRQPVLAISRLSQLHNGNRTLAHRDAGGGSRLPHHKRILLYSDYLPITGRVIRPSARRMMAPEPLPSSSCRAGRGCPGRFAWQAGCAAWRSWAPSWDSPAATPTAPDTVAGSCGRRS